jgi:hypothetical protein
MKVPRRALALLQLGAAFSALALYPGRAPASSHMDAPLITLDPAANTTDVYAFVTQANGQKYLTAALAVYPFEEPGIGPNKYNFDDNVLYELHVCKGPDLATGQASLSYQFRFNTTFKKRDTILQSFLDRSIEHVDDLNQNLTQRYSLTKVVHRKGPARDEAEVLGRDLLVPPNNQGLVTPYYNQNNDGNMPAKEGISDPSQLDRYTFETVYPLKGGYLAFAGQRDDGFYADIQSIFDLDFTFSGANKPFDSQGGFNVHLMALRIPLTELGGDRQIVGVYATTSRRTLTVLRDGQGPFIQGPYVQVGRQGNPLFCEGLVALKDKDRYNQTPPTADQALFSQYALAPELATLLKAPANLRTGRTDLAQIFIPDVIKVDLSTGPARLAGNPDEPGFHRLSIFGNDVLRSQVQPGFGNGVIPGGWPNGRRFGDDVLDIAVIAILSDLRTNPPTVYRTPDTPTANLEIDRVSRNDLTYNRVFPYEATPQNGRAHGHHGQRAQ